MRVVAFDPFVGAERYRELGVEKAETLRRGLRRGRLPHLHLPKTPETEGWLDADALAKCKDGVRVLNVARGPLVVDEDLEAALDSGKVGGAALDVFRSEPMTERPLFGRPNVIVTPHLGASTAEATDRAGFQAAEQVVAALTGGAVTTAVNVPADRGRGPRGARAVRAAVPARWGAWPSASPRARRSTASRSSSWAGSPSATPGRWPTAALLGVLSGRTEEEVNAVNAPSLAAERGIELVESDQRRGPRLLRPRARADRGRRPRGARRRDDARPDDRARRCCRRGTSASTSSCSTT